MLSAAIVVSSCSGNSEQERQIISEPKSKVEYCLKHELPEYYSHYELMKSDLINDSLVDDSKNSYAKLYTEIYDLEYTHTEIDSIKNSQYYFLNSLGPYSLIFHCSQIAKTDSVLTGNQQKYYEIFENSGKTGAFFSDSIADVIRSMSDEEFETNSVKETTVFYLGHKYIFNRYCTYQHREDVP